MADISEVTLIVKKEDGTEVSNTTYDIKDKIAREQLNAIPDGTYPDMSVGSVFSDDSYAEDQTPYLYRVSGGGVEVGKLEADKIVGGTIVWNQLVQNGDFSNGISGWYKAAGSISASNGEAEITIGGAWNNDIRQTLNIYNGHVYFMRFSAKADDILSGNVRASLTAVQGTSITAVTPMLTTSYQTREYIDKCRADQSDIRITLTDNASAYVGQKYYVKDVNLIDLTQMFGTTIADYIYSLEQSTAGVGVAWFKNLFPLDYYEYNAGELKSVEELQSHDMVGFNQWDEEWEVGDINSYTGKNGANANYWRSKNYIHVVSDTQYFASAQGVSSTPLLRVRFYDAGKNYIGYVQKNGQQCYFNTAFTTPKNAYYMRFSPSVDIVPADVCINLSSDRNGEYEPYVKHSYPLDSSLTLRGIPKLDASNNLYYDGDEYSADGKVVRKYGIVDMGTLKWNKNTDTAWYSSGVTDFAFVKTVGAVQYGNAITSKYIPTEITSATNGNFALYFNTTYSGYRLFVYDDFTGKNAAEVKAMLSGVLLVYELATPTEETAEPYDSIQKVSKYGTEEYVSTAIVPVGHVTKYPTDIVAKVNGLPSDFSTLIAPTETGFKATRAYSVNQFLIVNNQLYRVTSAIASGATITVGTNVTAVTVADILTSLLNA